MQNALNSKADASNIPTKTSDLTNDSGFITSSSLPTKVSDLTNDSGFITNTVNNLTNYYTKTNTYTKSEVDSLIGSVSSLDIQIVQTLPTRDISASTIYLVPKTASTNDNYDEYIYVNNAWEHIGSTEVDLSNYYTKTQTDNLLDDKADANSLSTVATTGSYNDLSNKPTIPTVNNATLTIQKNGTTVKTFTANSSSNVTANITVPTKTSDLTNDSGFVDNTYHDSTKQNSLVSGTNIKTINNESLLGSGNINITSGGGTMVDMRVNGSSIVDSNNVGNIATEGTYNATTNKIATMSDVPDSTSDLTNDSGFITNSVNNLTNYYTKAETDNLLDAETEYVDVSFLWTAAANGTAITAEQRTLIDTTNKYIFYIKVVDGYDRDYYYSTGRYQDTGDSYTTIDFIYNGEKWYRFYINRSNIVTKTSYNIQRKLVSGSTIKTINNTSLLGSGNISVATTSDIPTKTSDLTNDSGFVDNTYHDSSKQDTLVSGTNIKTINNESILGSGNISISSGVTSYNDLTDKPIYDASYVGFAEGSTITNEQYQELKDATINQNILNLNGKAATSYYNFGDIRIECTSGNQYSRFTVSKTDNNHTVSLTEFDLGYDSDIQELYATKQNTLVSGTNIKTINGDSILGSGDISVGGEKVPIGTIFEFPTDDATKLPTGYLFCDGSAVSRTQYADLFGVIGTTWGAGDGSTTFNLPSKAGLVTVGVSTDDEEFNTIGDTFGEKEHRLTINEIPSHNHNTVSMCSFPEGVANARTGYGYNEVALNKSSYGNSVSNTGGGYAHNNIQPTVVSNFIIKASNVSQLPDEAEVVDGYSTSTTDAYSANYINNMILNAVYPVGSIYMSVNSTSPATLFGGKWVAISQGRTLVGVGTGTDINGDSMTWTAETEGGEYFHTLTIDEMPSHKHVSWIHGNVNPTSHSESKDYFSYAGWGSSYHDTWENTDNTGGGQAHNNIQPFFAVYMWKRTA